VSNKSNSTSSLICEDCGVEIGETFFWEDKRVRCPKCYEEYIKLKESKRTEATIIENYL